MHTRYLVDSNFIIIITITITFYPQQTLKSNFVRNDLDKIQQHLNRADTYRVLPMSQAVVTRLVGSLMSSTQSKEVVTMVISDILL